MPVPYLLTLKADIWTSNLTQKLQLFEQIAALFNPSLEIQNTDNYIDWTSLSAIELTDTDFSSRTIPVGTDDPIDIMTMTFELPVWISPPVKVKKWGVIQKIVNSMYNENGVIDDGIFDEDSMLGIRHYITPLNYGVVLLNGEAQLIKYHQPADPIAELIDPYTVAGSPQDWRPLIDQYGAITEGVSQLRFGNVS